MRAEIILCMLGGLALPAAAINRCIEADGKTVFQDAPCAGAGGRIEVKPASGGGRPQAAGGVTEADRIEAQIKDSQRQSRRIDLRDRVLPRAKQEYEAHRSWCEAELRRLDDEQYRYVQNLYGKTHAAQIASEKAAASSRCDTRARELREQVISLEKECVNLDCSRL